MAVQDTHARIVRAVRSLHEEVGPAATTVTAVAERAGVQRLTVYRHLADERAMVEASAASWRADHPGPDPAGWSGIGHPAERLWAALGELYAWFRRGAPLLERFLRDAPDVPAVAEALEPWRVYLDGVAGGLAAGWGLEPERQRLLRAVVGHAVDFSTWRSLTGHGLDDEEAAEVMVDAAVRVSGGAP